MKIKIVMLEIPEGRVPIIDPTIENSEDLWSYVQFFRDLKKLNLDDPRYNLVFPIHKILKSEPVTVRRRISSNLFTTGDLTPHYYGT